MDKKEILKRLDHTLLGQTATWEDIRRILDGVCMYSGVVCKAGVGICRREITDLYSDRIS